MNALANMVDDLPCGQVYEKFILQHYYPSIESNNTSRREGETAVDCVFISNFGQDDRVGKKLEIKAEDGYWLIVKSASGNFIGGEIPPRNERPKDRKGEPVKATLNLFIERWSSKGKDGGPWQARNKGAVFFTDFFPHNNFCIEFRVDDLIQMLEAYYPLMRDDPIKAYNEDPHLTNIENTGWTTKGYKFPFCRIGMYCANRPDLRNRIRAFSLNPFLPISLFKS